MGISTRQRLNQSSPLAEEEDPTPSSWGYVDCEWKYVLAVVEERVLADTPLEIDEE
jgi:hypothetical protein